MWHDSTWDGKALDKIKTISQHNQGRNPDSFDYSFNLQYGKQYTDALPLTSRMRALIDSDTAANTMKTDNDMGDERGRFIPRIRNRLIDD